MFSCEFCTISKNTFFAEHVYTAASINKSEDVTVFELIAANKTINDTLFYLLSGKLPPGKFPPIKFPLENFHPENSHPGNSHLEYSHPCV